jgi:hypothetical protein
MKHRRLAVALSLLAAPALAANKCVEISGRIFYQDAPCPANTRGGDMSLNANRPFTGQAKPPPIAPSTPEIPVQEGGQDEGEKPPKDAG